MEFDCWIVCGFNHTRNLHIIITETHKCSFIPSICSLSVFFKQYRDEENVQIIRLLYSSRSRTDFLPYITFLIDMNRLLTAALFFQKELAWAKTQRAKQGCGVPHILRWRPSSSLAIHSLRSPIEEKYVKIANSEQSTTWIPHECWKKMSKSIN